MHQVIDKVLKSMRMHIDKRKVKLEIHKDATQFVVEGDIVHLTNVIFNLIDNALKYSPDAPELIVKTRNTPTQFYVSVTDNGIGISRDQQKKIFEKLYRVPTGNIHNVKGFGLGLSYVKVVIDKHNGAVKLDSELDVGSTFTVHLPFSQGLS
jgi:two-component system phosphate regulon sensor histidine kinase PhoR